MKKTIFFFLITIVEIISSTHAVIAQANTKDTIYKFEDFLIHPSDTMKIDFIVKNKPKRYCESKGDTLYDDNKYLVLGDADKLGYYGTFGIFKKYKMPYKFSMFKVKVYQGKLAPPNFETDAPALKFRTQIKNQCKIQGINFDGHFTVVKWGCGSDCMSIAIIDRITGKINYSNILVGVKYPFFELNYSKLSSMIIMNNSMLEKIKGYVYCSRVWTVAFVKWNKGILQVLPI